MHGDTHPGSSQRGSSVLHQLCARAGLTLCGIRAKYYRVAVLARQRHKLRSALIQADVTQRMKRIRPGDRMLLDSGLMCGGSSFSGAGAVDFVQNSEFLGRGVFSNCRGWRSRGCSSKLTF
jgi:hypothetical protein